MITRVSSALLIALSLAAAVTYLVLVGFQLRAPGELDYIEGVMMDHVSRLAHGQPIYVAPSLSFVALAYMPGIAWVSSWLARVFGPALWEPRLVSFIATLLLAALIGFVVRRETRSAVYAIAGSGLYLMGFGTAGGGHYIVSRPDSLMLLLVFSGLAILRFTEGSLGAMASAALLVLAFFTKQHATWFGAAALIHLALNQRYRLPAFALVWIGGCVGGFVWLSHLLGPWFSYYVWDVPSHWSELSPLRIQHYLGLGLFGMLGPLTVASVLTLAQTFRPWRGPAALWTWAALGAAGTGLMATLDPSAWHHVFIPSMVALSVLGPISCWRLVTQLSSPEPRTAPRAHAVAYLLLSLQFIPLIYGVHLELPHRGAAEARNHFLEWLRALPGPVIVVDHGFYSARAGKPATLQIIAIGDLERSHHNRLVRRDPHALERLFDPLRAGPDRPVLVTDDPLAKEGPLWASLAPAYRLADSLVWTTPLGGLHGHTGSPRYVYVPVEAAADTSHAPKP
ncbi:MAG TPA: hypothetical protein VL123_00945 [Candidatus Udaeobacter sp.]|jgi:hypothetical protein|nr:hypothetical protein [Candidatus Udaeobacter sp.]